MTIEELIRLDHCGHKHLEDLNEIQLNEYATLLQGRLAEVLSRIRGLRKEGKCLSGTG